MKLFAVCRGRPGLGRVAPARALVQALAAWGPVTAAFASYGPGTRYLAAVGETVTDLGQPDGLFIDSVAPQALRVLDMAEDADLILVDGEFFLPVVLAPLSAPVVYLANPHDLDGPPNVFRRVNRQLLGYCDVVIISALGRQRPVLRSGLIPGVPALEIPALCQDIAGTWEPVPGPPRVLVSTGGGSEGSPGLRAGTSEALGTLLTVLADLAGERCISSATVALGADAAVPDRWQQPSSWLHVIDGPVNLQQMYVHHDVLIARAGRNTLAEALYCGIPTVALPVGDDPLRAAEQRANASTVARFVTITPGDWRDPGALRAAVLAALGMSRGPRTAGPRGNEAAAAFITSLFFPDHCHILAQGAAS